MSYFRWFLLPASLGSVLLVTGANVWKGTPPSPADPPALPPQAPPDPEAVRLLDQALAALAPERVRWAEAAVWQRVSVRGLAYEAEGRYLLGPDHRLRLDLRTRVGRAEGELRVVCDGATLWQATRLSGGPWANVRRLDVNEVRALLDSPGVGPEAREQFLQAQGLAGPHPLLQGLRQRLTWVRKEAVRRNGRAWHKLTGTWSEEAAREWAPPGQPWPEGLPRQCRLYLDPQTLWPGRLEWWGPDRPRVGEVALLQMEFRDPVLNRALTAAECAREFAFDAGAAPVSDRTREVADQLRGAGRELPAGAGP
jgi:hypothetical protein